MERTRLDLSLVVELLVNIESFRRRLTWFGKMRSKYQGFFGDIANCSSWEGGRRVGRIYRWIWNRSKSEKSLERERERERIRRESIISEFRAPSEPPLVALTEIALTFNPI